MLLTTAVWQRELSVHRKNESSKVLLVGNELEQRHAACTMGRSDVSSSSNDRSSRCHDVVDLDTFREHFVVIKAAEQGRTIYPLA